MTKKPDWLRIPCQNSSDTEHVEQIISEFSLNTVCSEAECPNRPECFSKKTATFMILGKICTRSCGFCGVSGGRPAPVDTGEPERIAQAVGKLGLNYAVITSVTRDDLPDGGAGHFASVIRAVRLKCPDTRIEVLIPDFGGSDASLKTVTDAAPDVISHNMETVESLYSSVRPQADYTRSLALISKIRQSAPGIRTKSGFMLGLGEKRGEILKLLDDLRTAGCELLTIGQYLSPTAAHLPVARFVKPRDFIAYKMIAKEKGFSHAASAPLQRSSYNAGEMFEH